jgi:hypothetical protein
MAIGGAFQAAQGIMALFGTESAAVQKAIQNVIVGTRYNEWSSDCS